MLRNKMNTTTIKQSAINLSKISCILNVEFDHQ